MQQLSMVTLTMAAYWDHWSSGLALTNKTLQHFRLPAASKFVLSSILNENDEDNICDVMAIDNCCESKSNTNEHDENRSGFDECYFQIEHLCEIDGQLLFFFLILWILLIKLLIMLMHLRVYLIYKILVLWCLLPNSS